MVNFQFKIHQLDFVAATYGMHIYHKTAYRARSEDTSSIIKYYKITTQNDRLRKFYHQNYQN